MSASTRTSPTVVVVTVEIGPRDKKERAVRCGSSDKRSDAVYRSNLPAGTVAPEASTTMSSASTVAPLRFSTLSL